MKPINMRDLFRKSKDERRDTVGSRSPLSVYADTTLFQRYFKYGEVKRDSTWCSIKVDLSKPISRLLLDYETEGRWTTEHHCYSTGEWVGRGSGIYGRNRYRMAWVVRIYFECKGDAAMFRLLGVEGEHRRGYVIEKIGRNRTRTVYI